MPLPVSFELFPLHKNLEPGKTTTEHVLIQLRAELVEGRVRPKLSAVLVCDVSGSMQGEPIEQVIRSAERLTDILDDGDSLGIVAFESAAHTISKVRILDKDSRRAIKREIQSLHVMGSTNMSGGMARAALLFPERARDERQLALVMSDGQPNVGTSTAAGLADEAAQIKARGIATSTLGFGAHHDEDVLVAIADAGGGRYAFVGDPRMADASFARALGAQRDVVAEDLALLLTPSVGVKIVRVLGNPPTSFSSEGLRVQLSDAIAGDEFNAIVELEVSAIPETGPWCPLRVTLEGRKLGSEKLHRIRDEVAVTVTRNGPYDVETPVAAYTAIALASEARDEARALADRGNFAGAAAMLKKAREAIAQSPGFKEESEIGEALWDVYETLVDDITAMENRPDPEQYARYRKASRAYAQFGSAGLKGTQGKTVFSTPSADAMASLMKMGAVPSARFVVMQGGDRQGVVELCQLEMVIGRTSDCEIQLQSGQLSRRHTRVKYHDGAFWVFDLGSTNATHVNGNRVDRHRLENGDVVDYGDFQLIYEQDPQPS